jgi:hypothetical protein
MELRPIVLLLAVFAAFPARAQDSQRQAIEAERRALDAERRALDAERRAVQAEQRASSGSSAAPKASEACLAANQSYQRACAVWNVDPLWQAPQCADAEKLVQRYCG